MTPTTPHAAAATLAEQLDLRTANAPWLDHRWDGRPHAWPTLQLEDVTGIPFITGVPGVEEYQHRARVRCQDGDLFAAVTQPATGYEAYCRTVLGLGAPELVLTEPVNGPMAVARACAEGEAFATLVTRARMGDGLLIHPYMAIEPVWALASAIGAQAGVPVQVIGPPPPVTWIANDKARLSWLVRETLGDGWLVETRSAWTPAEMCDGLRELARRHARVALKRTRCASAMGNAVFNATTIVESSADDLSIFVDSFLRRTEWVEGEEVLVVSWEDNTHSPSTQLWIPHPEQGPPRLEGVYEQLLEGDERCFLGSRPSTLPPHVNRALGDGSIVVATALQALGYVGRCSFDFILGGDLSEPVQPKFVECNGRWGGTSTPMSLVDRLVDGPRPAYRAQDFVHPDLVGRPFPDILAAVGDDLFRPEHGTGRYVFYNVGPLARTGKLDVIAFGDDAADAERALLDTLPRHLGLT